LGGFWITPSSNVLWRIPLLQHLRNQLCTAENPTGPITNSDLELAAIILGSTLAAQQDPHTHTPIILASDNTPAVAWATKGSTTSTATNAFLLRNLAQQWRKWNFDVTPYFTPGSTNIVADSCSHLFHLSDDNFLWHMNHHYLVQPSWTLARLTPEMLSEMNLMLSRKLQPLVLPTPAKMLTEPPGIYGPTFALHSTLPRFGKH
jgi:hypothetical protein